MGKNESNRRKSSIRQYTARQERRLVQPPYEGRWASRKLPVATGSRGSILLKNSVPQPYQFLRQAGV
jgi:hypothetical protein